MLLTVCLAVIGGTAAQADSRYESNCVWRRGVYTCTAVADSDYSRSTTVCDSRGRCSSDWQTYRPDAPPPPQGAVRPPATRCPAGQTLTGWGCKAAR